MAASAGEPFPASYEYFEERESRALRAAHVLDAATLETATAELLIDTILNDHAAALITARYDDFKIETREVALHPDETPPDEPQPLEIELVLPVDGAAGALRSTGAVGRGSGSLYTLCLQLKIAPAAVTDDEMTSALAKTREQWFKRVATAVEDANARIRAHRQRTRELVEPLVRQRQRQRIQLQGAATALNIPLDQEPSAGAAIPFTPRSLTLAAAEAAANAGGSEIGLAADVARTLIDQIGSFATALERTPVTANRLAREDEETLRDVLLFFLNANWKGAVTGETFIGQGKADILLRWRNRDAFIGECKFWRGPKGFGDGLEQLLDRYLVWRATNAAMVLFIRNKRDVSEVIDSAEQVIKSHTRYIGPSDTATGEHAAFLMQAQHDRQQIVVLTLIPVVMPDRS